MSCWTETIIHLVSCLEFFVFGCWSFLIGGTQWNNHGFSSFHENISRFISSLRNLRIEYVMLPIKWIFSSLLNETFENSLNEYNINQLRFSIFDLWSSPGLLFSRWMDHCYKERKKITWSIKTTIREVISWQLTWTEGPLYFKVKPWRINM